MTDAVIEALRSEFSDLSDPARVTAIVVRLLLAALLGGALGYQRERSGKSAGMRTHMLVAIGSALFVVVPLQGGMPIGELGRVIQGIVTGIGFLGAGAIIKHRSDEHVLGLTTAAGVWMTAAIGVTCGLGRESTALLGTALALAVLALIPHLAARAPFEAQDSGRDADR
ncbi:MAG TPA: MgtC/SapB family protein [Caldimonas sp.]